jgi:PIN domain nuclease of toxin-antitoxin system
MIYVLDACAIIAYLRKEVGADVVEAALLDTTSQCTAHAINLCEVFYLFHRSSGEANANQAIEDMRLLGVFERVDFDDGFWKEAGRLKARGKVSLPDCFAITLTNRVGGTMLTSDHSELDPIAAAGVCAIKFIR